MAVLFLDGIRIPFGDILIYVPFTAILAVVAVVVLPHPKVRPHGLVPLIGFSAAVAVSSTILVLQGGTGHQIGGLAIVMYAWVGLVAGTVLSIRKGDGIELAGLVLFTLVSIAFVQALQSSTITLTDYYSLQPDYVFKHKLVTLFGASNYLAAFLLFFYGYGVVLRNFRLVLIATAGLAMTESRAAIVVWGLFTLLILGEASLRRVLPASSATRQRVLAVALVASVASATAAIVYSGAVADQNLNVLTLSSRTILWETAATMIADNPFVGYGNGVLIAVFGVDYAHNWFLDVWLSYGVVAAFMFGAYLYVILRGLYSTWRHATTDKQRSNAAGILAGLTLIIAEGMIEPVLFGIPFVLLIGFIGSPLEPVTSASAGASDARHAIRRPDRTRPPFDGVTGRPSGDGEPIASLPTSSARPPRTL